MVYNKWSSDKACFKRVNYSSLLQTWVIDDLSVLGTVLSFLVFPRFDNTKKFRIHFAMVFLMLVDSAACSMISKIFLVAWLAETAFAKFIPILHFSEVKMVDALWEICDLSFIFRCNKIKVKHFTLRNIIIL